MIDFVIVCDNVLPFVQKLLVDEGKTYALSNYSKDNRITHNDHNSMITELNLKVEEPKPERVTVFDWKNDDSWKMFKKMTSIKGKYTKIFQSSKPFNKQVNEWEKMLKKTIHLCFKKVRLTRRRVFKNVIKLRNSMVA